MSLETELKEIADTYAKLVDYYLLVPKPVWKKYELAVSSAYILRMNAKVNGKSKKAVPNLDAISSAKLALLSAVESKIAKLAEFRDLLKNKASDFEEDFDVDESEEDGYEEPAPEPHPSAPQNKAVKGMLGNLLKQKG